MLWFAMADEGVICLERFTYYVESLVKFQVSLLYSSEIVVYKFKNVAPFYISINCIFPDRFKCLILGRLHYFNA